MGETERLDALEDAIHDILRMAHNATLCVANQDETRRNLPGEIIKRIEEISDD